MMVEDNVIVEDNVVMCKINIVKGVISRLS